MTGEDLIDSMEYVDAQLVEAAEDTTSVKKKRWKPVEVIAACLAVFVGIGVIIPKQYFPIFLSAEGLVRSFEEKNILDDSGYDPGVVVEKGLLPQLNPLPTAKTAPVFHRNDTRIPKNDKKLQKWSEPIRERICDSLGTDYDAYDIATGYNRNVGLYYFAMEKSRYKSKAKQLKMWLDGELVTIDPNQSDEEIIAALETIKQKLFVIFDVDFSDVKVVRYSSEYVHVFYYDETAHLLNQTEKEPVTDHIEISVNREDYQGFIRSEDERITTKIKYYQYRRSPYRRYQTIGSGKLISLEEAEEMLAKGYVFGRKCQECMAAQREEGCSHYDYVSFEYVADRDRKGLNLVIPCYAFYNKTGEWDSGELDGELTRYSITYVCAIEVWGLEKYFERQMEG